MAPCALSYASDGGAARICQRGAKARERSDRAGEGVGGGFPLPRQGDFSKFVSENGIFSHIRYLYQGQFMKWHRPIPYSCSFFILFLMNLFQGNIFLFLSFFFCFTRRSMGGGGGHGPLVHLCYSSNSGAAKICQRGQSEGAKRPSEGRFFPNLCMKLAFFAHQIPLLGVVYVLAQTNSLFFFFFHSFPNESFRETFSFFSFLFPFFRLLKKKKKKKKILGGATAPIAPPPWLRQCQEVKIL